MRLLRWIHPPGTAPGTIADRPETEGQGHVTLVRYSPTELDEVQVEDLEIVGEKTPGRIRWVDVSGRDVALIAATGRRLAIDPLAVEDVVNGGQRPKVEDYEGCLFIVAHHLERREPGDPVSSAQLSLVLLDGALVSFEERSSAVFEPVRNRLRTGNGKIRTRGPDYLAYALIDAVIDHCFPLLDDIGARIEEAEEAIADDPDPANAAMLHDIRRDLILMRRSVWPMRDMLLRWIKTESDLVKGETRVFLRDVADHLAVIADMVDAYREIVNGLMDLHHASASNRMNEVMKVLTIIATIFIPLSFIAGLYGMNFSTEVSPLNMPELGWYWGYPAALGIMTAVAVGLLLFFKRRGWL